MVSDKSLANDIEEFIKKYAAKNPNFDPKWDEEEEMFTGPDPIQLLMAAKQIRQGIKPDRIWSEWGSGCFKPYNSSEGKKLHDELLSRIKNLES